MTSARALRFGLQTENQYKDQGFSEEWSVEYLNWLFNQFKTFESDLITVHPFEGKVWEMNFIATAGTETVLMLIALLFIYIYSFFVLGSCSPIHMRIVTAVIGLSCVGLSIGSGYGLAFAAGYKFSDMHTVLPFLILGLGVDDMFVIVNTID